jgi:hypothetical protein
LSQPPDGLCREKLHRVPIRYDRARVSLDPHTSYIVAAYVAGAYVAGVAR